MKTPLFPLAFALVFLATVGSSGARQIEGVNVPERVTVGGRTLVLNGAGVRSITLAFIPIKAYVAAFYAPQPLRSTDAVMASTGPMRFDFTFLQGVGQGQVTSAWNAQFKTSCTAAYPGLARDQAAFVKMFGPLGSGGVETVVLSDAQTLVSDSGVPKGVVAGRDFQRAFLSMWFGSQPVMPSLKADLLGK